MPAFISQLSSTFIFTPPFQESRLCSTKSRRQIPLRQIPCCQQRPNSPSQNDTPTPPKPPPILSKPPPRPPAQSPNPVPTSSQQSATTSSPTPTLKRPNDPTSMRTESQRRRNSPPHSVRRPRRRRRGDQDTLDWESAESVPLATSGGDKSSKSGEDYWMELKPIAEVNKRRKARMKYAKKIDEGLKDKLKKEVVSPYANNWILWISLAVFALAVLVKVMGTDLPIISIPDV